MARVDSRMREPRSGLSKKKIYTTARVCTAIKVKYINWKRVLLWSLVPNFFTKPTKVVISHGLDPIFVSSQALNRLPSYCGPWAIASGHISKGRPLYIPDTNNAISSIFGSSVLGFGAFIW